MFTELFNHGAVDTSGSAWLQAMLDAEAALARAAERAGLAPSGSGAAVTAAARPEFIDNAGLAATAAQSGNPVPGLVRALTARVPAAARDAVHLGATSQDIIDTAAMLLASRASRTILGDLAIAADHAARLAKDHAGTVMAGRTLLQQAVPVTFGLVAAGWLTAIDEARTDLIRVSGSRLAVQYGGAAGTLAALGEAGPHVAALLAEELGLAVPVLPWHTDRLRIIQLGAALAGACTAVGKLARDVTLLAQSEVAEVHEGAGGAGQRGGSSTMPHKQNPVVSVLVLGCAKRAPGLLATLTAAAEQEHQRAAGAWHAEWETLSDLLRLTGSAAAWCAELLSGLRVDPGRMRANLDASHGLPMAENLAAQLAPTLGRLAAHDLVARAVSEGVDLADALLVAGLDRQQVEAALRPESYLGASAEFIRRALAAHAAS